MKKLLLLAMLMCSPVFATTKTSDSITFDGEDFFAVNNAYSESLLSDFTEKLLTLEGNTLYMYFDSPGGSVISMLRFIELMKTSPNIKFICVARFAASAAFMTLQYCDERYILPDGILMAHNASGSFSDEFPRIRTQLDVIEGAFIPVEKHVAKRLKISFSKYKQLINSNFWLNQTTALKNNAVDGNMTKVSCTKETVQKQIKRVQVSQSLFGSSSKTVTLSACPLITNEK